MFTNIRLDRKYLAVSKRSSLLSQSVGNSEKKFYKIYHWNPISAEVKDRSVVNSKYSWILVVALSFVSVDFTFGQNGTNLAIILIPGAGTIKLFTDVSL